jgi:aconitate hydratase
MEKQGAKLLIKAFGKCTTDHISMVVRGCASVDILDNISNNMLIGAINAFNQKQILLKINYWYLRCGSCCCACYKAAGVPSIVVGDHNYGEGSSRTCYGTSF